MFRSSTWISSLFVFLLSATWLIYLCALKQDNSSNKETLKAPTALSQHQTTAAKQTRTQVRKDIWVSEQGLTRLHNRIDSEKSFLVFLPHEKSLEVTEHLYGIRCWSQEKIFTAEKNPIQQMRFLEAKEGTYKYQTQTFQALDANLSLYKIPGLSLPLQLHMYRPFLKGNAEEISFAIQSGVPSFQAHQFHASLNQGSSF